SEVGFNIEEIEGANTASSLAGGNEAKYRDFIRRFFALVWQAPGVLKVREFESALGHLLSDEPVTDEQNEPFAIVSVSHDGAISTFSPELLGAHHPRFGDFAFGGGAAANKLFETGRFDTTETMHCRLTRQVVLDEVIAGIEANMRPANVRPA